MTPITLSGARRLVAFTVGLFGGRDRNGRIAYPVMCSSPDTAALYRRAFLPWEAEGDPDAATRREQFMAAAGDCICPGCNTEYRDHPADPADPLLNILCSRRRVKL